MKPTLHTFCLLPAFLSVLFSFSLSAETNRDLFTDGSFRLAWEVTADCATMTDTQTGRSYWRGGLLPAFWLQDSSGEERYVKAEGVRMEELSAGVFEVALKFSSLGTGRLRLTTQSWGVSFDRLSVQWNGSVPKIIEMYWGTTAVDPSNRSMLADPTRPFSPDWEAAGYCVPGAKEGPAQSFFRFWDFGHSAIALGSFGPSMGAPYGAAFPRPVLFFAMGDHGGWINFGVGQLPDAALALKLQSGLGTLRLTYREDLWGAPLQAERVWEHPLKMTFGKTAYQSFESYYASFPVKKQSAAPCRTEATWNTWGDWKDRRYPIRPIADFASRVGCTQLVIDDPWQRTKGGTGYNDTQFPQFPADLSYVRQKGMETGYWETLGWIENPEECGLTPDDLILDRNGRPCRTSWNFNPLNGGFYFIDISSVRAQEYLKRRTLEGLKLFSPRTVKLDFGYGVPGPQMGVPRNAAIRGERYPVELIKLIASTIKEARPEVTILYYGISPLLHPFVDMISLDDQGDLWYAVKEGHDQWTLWASLAANSGIALTGSSSYDWTTDDEVILNSFLLGSPNAVLPTRMPDGSAVPSRYLNRRLAVARWYRHSTKWQPEWFDSHRGDLTAPPRLNCVGRREGRHLTMVALRGETVTGYPELENFHWRGRWAVVSQDGTNLFESECVAFVPFDAGTLRMRCAKPPRRVERHSIDGQEPSRQWTWADGVLELTVSETDLRSTAGFVAEF